MLPILLGTYLEVGFLGHKGGGVQLLSCVGLFVTPRTAARQASLSITISQSLLKLTSFKSVMPSNHLTLCCPLLFLPSIFPSIRVFSNESVLHIRWPKYQSFNFSRNPEVYTICVVFYDSILGKCYFIGMHRILEG